MLASSSSSAEAERALGDLCLLYWQPVYAFFRRHGSNPDEAEDLTQGLFLHLLVSGDMQKADPARGRFRTYLKSCARNFAASKARAALAQKRGGDVQRISIDRRTIEGDLVVELADLETPEQTFERHFAKALVKQVLDRMVEDAKERGKDKVFMALRCYLEAGEAPAFADKAAVLSMSEGAVRVSVHRMRDRFRELLLAEVRHTLADPADAACEIDQLLVALAGPKKTQEGL